MDPEEEGEDFEELIDPEEELEGDPPEEPSEEQDPEEEAPAPKPSRAQARIEALDREVREARERAEAAERKVDDLISGRSRADAERVEQERLAQMDPYERLQHETRAEIQRTRGELGALRQETADSTDRAEFAAVCAANPALAKVKDRVETELSKLRAGRVNMPRITLAKYLIGEEVLGKAPKARERAAKRGAANLDRERARPAGGASDAPAQGRDTGDKAARDKRLDNFTF